MRGDWRAWLEQTRAEAESTVEYYAEVDGAPTLVVEARELIQLIDGLRRSGEALEEIAKLAPHTSVVIDLAHPAEIAQSTLDFLRGVGRE